MSVKNFRIGDKVRLSAQQKAAKAQYPDIEMKVTSVNDTGEYIGVSPSPGVIFYYQNLVHDYSGTLVGNELIKEVVLD